MRKWLAVSFSALAVGLPAVGCGGDDGEEEGGGEAATEQPGGQARTVTVVMKDIKFVPEDVTVPVGGTIRWTNSDQVAHTVTKEEGPGPRFDSGNVEAGEEYERTFRTAAKIDYVCTIHPNQTGTITVE